MPSGEHCTLRIFRAEDPSVLRRYPVTATSFHLIGKESDKHWEEGEDLSLLDFKTIEYKRRGYAIATE